MMNKFLVGLALALFSSLSFSQSAIIRGEVSAGNYENIKTDGSQRLIVSVDGAGDPCLSNKVAKSSVAVNITSATTTALVALSGTTKIYVCAAIFTISQVVTTANTLKFVQGTGATCGVGTADLTGLFGAGGVTAAAPIVISLVADGTEFSTIAGNALCATTTIGGSGSFQGVVTYVQQ